MIGSKEFVPSRRGFLLGALACAAVSTVAVAEIVASPPQIQRIGNVIHLHPSGGDDTKTVQAALDLAGQHGLVVMMYGVHLVSKGLLIHGTGGTLTSAPDEHAVIRTSGEGPILHITDARNWLVANMTFDGVRQKT